MEDIGFYHEDRGAWVATSVRGNDHYNELFAAYPLGTIRIPLAPVDGNDYEWTGDQWSVVEQPELTPDEKREAMFPITQRQLRLTLVRNGISLGTVQAALYGMEDGLAKDEAIIEWDSASTYNRTDPTLLTIASALSLSPEQVDAMWEQALAA